MRRALLTLAFVLALPASASAAPAWLPTQTIHTGTSDDLRGPELAVNPAGAAIVAWRRSSTVNGSQKTVIEAAYKPANGSFGAPETITQDDFYVGTPAVAIDDDGRAVVAFILDAQTAAYRARNVDGAWGGVSVPDHQDPASNPLSVSVAFRGGHLALGWVGEPNDRAFYGASGPLDKSLTAVQLDSSPGSGDASVDVDSAGDALFAWAANNGVYGQVHVREWPAGGSVSPDTTMFGGTSQDDRVGTPAIRLQPTGEATLAYKNTQHNPPVSVVTYTRDAPADAWGSGTWKSRGPSSGAYTPSGEVSLALLPGDGAVMGWNATNGNATLGSRLPGNTAFGPFTDLGKNADALVAVAGSAGGSAALFQSDTDIVAAVGTGPATPIATEGSGDTFSSGPGVGIDDQGNVIVAQQRIHCDSPGVNCTADGEVELYDNAAPTITSSAIPATGAIGTPLAFSGAAVDRISAVSYSWSFGDGATGAGASVQHAYAAAGTYTVTLTATDGVGNATSQTGTVVVSAKPVTPPPVKPAKVSAAASAAWKALSRYTTVKKLVVKSIPAGATVYVKCSGGKKLGCKLKTTKKYKFKKATKSKDLTSLFKHVKLKPKAKVEIGISAPKLLGKFTTWTMQKQKSPKKAAGCLSVGGTKHTSC